jgi:hypothetical protein
MENNAVINVVPNQVPQIPPDWASLGAVSGYNPPTPEKLRLLIDGPEGEGKSTFVASMPNNLILDFEGGAGGVVGPRSTRIKVNGFDHYMQITDKLIAESKGGNPFFKRFTFDTADRWSEMIARQVAKENNVPDIADYGAKGAGYRVLKNRAWYRVQGLEDAGYGWAIVGHLTEKTITDPTNRSREITVPRLALFDSLRSPLSQGCDFHATVYNLTTEVPKMVSQVVPGVKDPIQVQVGSEISSTYWFSCVSVGGKQGKARGVPSMEAKFQLPLMGGWDLFVQKYNEAVIKAKGKVS